MKRNIFQYICMCLVACSLLLQGVASAAMVGCHESSSGQASMHEMREHSDSAVMHSDDHHQAHSHAAGKTDKAQKDKAGDCCDCHAACKVNAMLPFSGEPAVKISTVVLSTTSLAYPSSDLIPPFRPPISA